jgi:anaerobic ribonucleoside-triphosphate reductase activating protein
MQINSYQKNSLIDYPGEISCVVFCQGCNRHCVHCHNKDTIEKRNGNVEWSEIETFLQNRKDFITAVVFSGGEPTLQEDLKEKIIICKDFGFKIGLHSNGDLKQFTQVSCLCDYILLSQFNDEKIKIACEANSVSTSKVVWNQDKDDWENIIKVIKGEKKWTR